MVELVSQPATVSQPASQPVLQAGRAQRVGALRCLLESLGNQINTRAHYSVSSSGFNIMKVYFLSGVPHHFPGESLGAAARVGTVRVGRIRKCA